MPYLLPDSSRVRQGSRKSVPLPQGLFLYAFLRSLCAPRNYTTLMQIIYCCKAHVQRIPCALWLRYVLDSSERLAQCA